MVATRALFQLMKCIHLVKKSIHFIIILMSIFIVACSSKKEYTVQTVQRRTTYQQKLEGYIGKDVSLLVKKIGAPDAIRKEKLYTLFEWRSIEPVDKDFWWIGKTKCITRIFINRKSGKIEDVFSYGNRCVPF